MLRGNGHRRLTVLAVALIAIVALFWSGVPASAATFDQLDQQISGSPYGGASVDPGFPDAQTFTPSVTGPLPKVDMEVGGSNVSITVEIRQLGSGGAPTGTLLAAATRAVNQVSGFTTFTFATPPTLTAGTEYAIVLTVPAGQRGGYTLYSNTYTRGVHWTFGGLSNNWEKRADDDLGFRTYVSVTDTTAPTVVTRPAADGCSQPGSAGWCRGTQTAGFTASDAGAGLAAANGCAAAAATCDFTKSTTTNGAAVTIASGSVADVGGNTNPGINSAPYKIDSQAPAVTANAAANSCTVPGTIGWCRGTQTAGFTAGDSVSGLPASLGCAAGATTCGFTRTSMTEGGAVTIASGAVADVAGNSNAGITAGPFKIDRTAPTFAGTPANVAVDQTSPAGATATFPTPTATDSLDPMPGVACVQPSGSTFPVGVTTVTCTATDSAGNAATTSFTVTVRRTFCGAERATIIITTPNVTTTGTAGRDVILGTSGRDIIRAGAGDDRVCGDGGDDEIHGEGGDDQIYGEGGSDTLDGGYGDDTLQGGDGDDRLVGSFGNDTLAGDAGADTLDGDGGTDRLDGGTGNDTLRGGAGNDTLIDPDTPNALMDGGPGTNTCSGAAISKVNCGP